MSLFLAALRLLDYIAHSFNRRMSGNEFSLLVLEHALASPLTVLRSTIAEVKPAVGRSSPVLRSQQALDYMESVVANLIKGKAARFDCYSALREVVSLSQTEKMQISLVIDARLRAKPPQLYGNKVRLQEALHCMIKNAYLAYAEQSESGVVIVTALPQGQHVKVSIADYGCGMNYWQQKIATVPLLTLRSDGSGIGLSFARDVIVREFAGTLTILSNKNVGTTMQITLPLSHN